MLRISGFLPFGDFVCFVFLLDFFFLVGIKRKNMKMDCGGSWELIGFEDLVGVGGGEKYDQNILYEIFKN